MKTSKLRNVFDLSDKNLGTPVLGLKAAAPIVLEYCWCCGVEPCLRIVWLLDLIVDILIVGAAVAAIYCTLVRPPWEDQVLHILLIASCSALGVVALVCACGALASRIKNLQNELVALKVAATIVIVRVLLFTAASFTFVFRAHPPRDVAEVDNWIMLRLVRNWIEFAVALCAFAAWPLTLWLLLGFKTLAEKERRRMVVARVKGARQAMKQGRSSPGASRTLTDAAVRQSQVSVVASQQGTGTPTARTPTPSVGPDSRPGLAPVQQEAKTSPVMSTTGTGPAETGTAELEPEPTEKQQRPTRDGSIKTNDGGKDRQHSASGRLVRAISDFIRSARDTIGGRKDQATPNPALQQAQP